MAVGFDACCWEFEDMGDREGVCILCWSALAEAEPDSVLMDGLD